MTILALALVITALVSRLPMLMKDHSVKTWEVLVSWGFQLAIACILMKGFTGQVWIGLGVVVIHAGIHLCWWYFERQKQTNKHILRFGISVLLILIAIILGSPWTGSALRDYRPWLDRAAYWFTPFDLLTQASWRSILVTAFGLLLCLNEANALIRWAIERMSLKPTRTQSGEDEGHSRGSGGVDSLNFVNAAPPSTVTSGGESADVLTSSEEEEPIEYKRGRLIGVLERIIIFTLVLNGQYTAMAFVLTAKSMARFKTLENRDFAEYFILGTLMSVVLAGGLAITVNRVR